MTAWDAPARPARPCDARASTRRDTHGALSAQLGEAKLTPTSVHTTAAVTFEKTDAGFTVSRVHLDVVARVRGASQASFDKAAANAKTGCTISRLLKAEITMTAKLEA